MVSIFSDLIADLCRISILTRDKYYHPALKPLAKYLTEHYIRMDYHKDK